MVLGPAKFQNMLFPLYAVVTTLAWGFIVEPIPESIQEEMRRSTWRHGCPVPLKNLALLDDVPYWGFDGRVHEDGQLVVHHNVSKAVWLLFSEMFQMRFPIHKMRLMYHYHGDDNASMADNNTSAFNCRLKTGGSKFSVHSYGLAVDINPLENPYVKGKVVLPTHGRSFLNRTEQHPGMLHLGSPVVSCWRSAGWEWGGDWTTLKDYQHFEIPS